MSVTSPSAISISDTHLNLPRALLWSLVAHAVVLTLGLGISTIAGVDAGLAPPATNLAARLHGAPSTQPIPAIEPAAIAPLPAPITSSTPKTPTVRPPRPPATINATAPIATQSPASAPSSVAPTPTQTTPEAVRAIDPGGLRAYHLALGRSARLFKNYPPGLREAGVRGRVTIRVTVKQDGQAMALRLIGSSGHAELDDAAMTMMQLAASHTRVPNSLLGQTFSIDLAVEFSPEDQP